jgi:ribosomal protein L37E
MELTGLDIGLASEGSFGPHPVMPWVPWNVEIVLLVDQKEKLEICGEYASFNTNDAHEIVSNFTEAENFARKVGFPEHWLVLRPDNERHQSIVKDINDWEHLKEAVVWGIARSATGKVFLETDMRAHANPTRMANIQKAAENLVEKMKKQCPRCGTPGFSVTDRKKGLPCEWCGRPTEEIMAVVFTCARCGFSREEIKAPDERAPAGRCQYCNP